MATNVSSQQSEATAMIREIVSQQNCLQADLATLSDDSDLYAAGLTSLATVGLMLAIEDRFDIEFPQRMLGRATFRSVTTIAEAVSELVK
ncbi:MAG TPA: acyl carrier protein [Pirellulales bacterium]|jgi:acyl carrier protein|nr:acyl carrier protein [Pirellulales bacterium]